MTNALRGQLPLASQRGEQAALPQQRCCLSWLAPPLLQPRTGALAVAGTDVAA